MQNKISSFILNSAKSSGFSGVFVSQPDSLKENIAGKFFVLADFGSNKNSDGQKIFDFLTSSLEEFYYNDENLLLKDKIEGLKIENIFEAALSKTNSALNDFLETEKIKLNKHNVNLTLGVVFENKLHFSNFGKNRALLVYRQKEGYQIINVETNAFEKENSKEKLENKEPKVFSSVISGDIPKNAYFIFSSESLPEYLSEKEMVTIVSKLPPLTAASQMKNILEQINTYVTFFCVIIKSTSELDLKSSIEEEREIIKAHDSISSLNHTERKTEEMLSSGNIINISSLSKKLKNFISEKTTVKNNKVVRRKIDVDEGSSVDGIKHKDVNPELGIIRTMSSVSKDSKILRPKLSFKKDKILIPFSALNNFINLIKKKIAASNNKKLLFSSIGAIALLLFFSIYFTSVNNKNKEIRAEFDKLVMEIENNESAIDMRLLYNDTEGAKTLLLKAKNSLNYLPEKTEEQQNEKSSIAERLKAEEEKIYKIKHLSNKEEVLNLDGKDASFINLAKEKLFAISKESIIDTDNKEISITDDYLKFTPQSGSEISYFNEKSLLKLNPETKKTTKIDFASPAQNIKSIETYANNIYLLDKDNNQIEKRTSTANGFKSVSSWFKESADLSKAEDLFIDVEIYILNNDGSVLKYKSGTKQDYGASSLEPESNTFNKITGDSEYIYVFNSKEKRMAILSRTSGLLDSQYILDDIDSIKDIDFDATNKIIYALSTDNIIYKYTLK